MGAEEDLRESGLAVRAVRLHGGYALRNAKPAHSDSNRLPSCGDLRERSLEDVSDLYSFRSLRRCLRTSTRSHRMGLFPLVRRGWRQYAGILRRPAEAMSRPARGLRRPRDRRAGERGRERVSRVHERGGMVYQRIQLQQTRSLVIRIGPSFVRARSSRRDTEGSRTAIGRGRMRSIRPRGSTAPCPPLRIPRSLDRCRIGSSRRGHIL